MTAKACPFCGKVSANGSLYCPDCRRAGRIIMLKTASQLQRDLDAMRKRAAVIKTAIDTLGGEA